MNGTMDSWYGTAALTGTYTTSVDSDGRGTMTISSELNGFPTAFELAFYVASSSEITLIGVNADVLGSAKQQ